MGTIEPTAYSLPSPTYRAELTEVGRGKPMGEFLRRYWHAIGLAHDAGDSPRKVRVLGEDLILFRDGKGRAGLLYPRCCHRGTTLYFGRCEDSGIRCCYHGWVFDVEGRCVEMPLEPDNGARVRQRVRQPWYPVEERYGLIFAYLGPPEKMPLLPRYGLLENLAEGEVIDTDDSNLGSGGVGPAPCNWLQHFENVVDPFHVVVLHDSFSGTQFVGQMGIMPSVKFEYCDNGVRTHQHRDTEDGKHLHRITEALLPTLRVVASPRLQPGPCESIGFTLPIDDTHYTIYTAARTREKGSLAKIRSRPGGKMWVEMSEKEHQKFPGDWEAQVGQGAVTMHSEENLVSTDQGIGFLRRLLAKQVELVAKGGDPIGWTQKPGEEWITSDAGNYFK